MHTAIHFYYLISGDLDLGHKLFGADFDAIPFVIHYIAPVFSFVSINGTTD